MEFLDRLPDPVEKLLRKLLRRPEDPTYLPQVEALVACDLFARFPRPASVLAGGIRPHPRLCAR